MSLDEEVASGPQAPAIWTQASPRASKDLLERVIFHLTSDEAQFIIDRLIADQPSALLTLLAREGINAQCGYI